MSDFSRRKFSALCTAAPLLLSTACKPRNFNAAVKKTARDPKSGSREPYIMLSHHRSGSNFLNEVVGLHSKIEFLNEPLSMHTDFFRIQDLIPWKTGQGSGPAGSAQSRVDHLQELPELSDFMKDLSSWMSAAPAGHVRGIKETVLFEKIAWFKSLVPNGKYIFLLRSPRAVVASIIRRQMHDRLWMYSTTVPRFLGKYSSSIGIDYKEIPKTPLELASYSWKIRMRYILKERESLECTTVRLEDVVRDPRKEVLRILDFMNLSLEQPMIDFIEQSQRETRGGTYSSFRSADEVLNTWKKVLSDDDVKVIDRITGPEAKELGIV